MRRIVRWTCWSLLLATLLFFLAMRQPQFWELSIRDYEAQDRHATPPYGAVLFTGSSSIRLWKTLREDMQGLDVINRGFGGSRIADVNHYVSRIVLPYEPSVVVLYAGDNDLSFPVWKSPEAVLADFQEFVRLVHADLPETWIYYVSMKPAPSSNWDELDQANRLISAYIGTEERVRYIDVSTAMLDASGQPRAEYYDDDPQHMNAAGYALWTSILKPELLKEFQR